MLLRSRLTWAAASAVSLGALALLPLASARSPPFVRVHTRGEHDPRRVPIVARQAPAPATFAPSDAQQQPVVQDAKAGNYVQAAQAADAIPGVQSTANGNLASVPRQIIAQDGQQYPWFADIPVTSDPSVNGSEDGGWQSLPQIQGFTFNESFAVYNKWGNESGIFPYYIAVDDPQTVERFIVVFPGKPRDVWNYANLMLNARNIPVTRGQQGVQPWADWKITNSTVGIVAPAFMNLQDLQAGACKPQYLCWNNSYWQQGGSAKNPPNLKSPISSFLAMDQLLDQLFLNTTYPNLKQVVVAGHSLGGQGAQRYAVLKKTKAYDPNVRYWIGNPGSWAYLTSKRPNTNDSAVDTYDEWPYGIHQNTSKVPSYARRDVIAQNGTLVAERYRNRTGFNHLDRGSKFVIAMGEDFPEGFPPNHTADFEPNLTHLDYGAYTANMSLQRLFYDGLRTPNPWLTNVTNPGDKPHHNHTNHTQSNGTHAFATPKHKTMARSLLGGSVGIVALIYFLLPFLFTENYQGAWEEDPGTDRKM